MISEKECFLEDLSNATVKNFLFLTPKDKYSAPEYILHIHKRKWTKTQILSVDIYSLGLIIYELFDGTPLYKYVKQLDRKNKDEEILKSNEKKI